MFSIRAFNVPASLCWPLLLLFATSPANSTETQITRSLHPEIEYRKIPVISPGGTVSVHITLIDLDALRSGDLVVELASGSERVGHCASPESIGRRLGAIASINGPYFAAAGSRTYPLGFTVMNGQIAQLGSLDRPIVGMAPDGELGIEVAHPRSFITSETYFEPIWLWSVNAPAGSDAVTLYDRNWGERISPQGGTVVAVAPVGSEVESEVGSERIVIEITEQSSENWDGVVSEISSSESIEIPVDGYALVFRGRSIDAVERYQPGVHTAIYIYELPDEWESMRWIATLGPWFVHDGYPRDFSDETSYGSDITGRAMRSAIGTTWNNEMFFAVTRGAGLSVGEAAEVLIECNVRDAVMCDSGGSSGMWLSGVGTIGNSRRVPLAFVVREPDGEEYESTELKIWSGSLFRH